MRVWNIFNTDHIGLDLDKYIEMLVLWQYMYSDSLASTLSSITKVLELGL